MFSFNRLALVGIVGALVSHTAVAADMSFGMAPPPPLDEARVEIGTGWYLRGDVSGARENTPKLFSDMTLSPDAKGQNGWSASLGAGYKFNNWLRTDLTYDLRNTLKADAKSAVFACPTQVNPYLDGNGQAVGWNMIYGPCSELQKSTLKRQSVLLNGYVDIGTWNRVTPYVGAGVGVTAGKARGDKNWWYENQSEYKPNITMPTGNSLPWVNQDGTPAAAPTNFVFGQQNKHYTYSRSMFNFTWALMAGVAVDVSSNAKVDLGYRYINMGRFGQDNGGEASTAHEYRVGLRYMID